MRLVAITNDIMGYTMPIILRLNETKINIRVQPDYKETECDQFLVLGRKKGEQREHTYNVLAEVSSSPSRALPKTSSRTTFKIRPYELSARAAA